MISAYKSSLIYSMYVVEVESSDLASMEVAELKMIQKEKSNARKRLMNVKSS